MVSSEDKALNIFYTSFQKDIFMYMYMYIFIYINIRVFLLFEFHSTQMICTASSVNLSHKTLI